VNRIVAKNKAVRDAEKLLRDEVKKDPEWAPFVQHWIYEGFDAEHTADLLWRVKRDLWFRQRGYRRRVW
jgi:hypothetical protein